jgi:hypothetical protein
MKESTAKEVTIKEMSFPVLRKLIEYLYTDKVELDGDTVLELFTAADKFDQPHLKYVYPLIRLLLIDIIFQFVRFLSIKSVLFYCRVVSDSLKLL